MTAQPEIGVEQTVDDTMLVKVVLPVLALSTIISAQDLHRHRKERYVIRDLDIGKAVEENQRDQLRQEVCMFAMVPFPLP